MDDSRELGWGRFLALLVLQLWAAHAVVFFAHEYGHSFTAWLLGAKANPLALNYAHPTLKVLLMQSGIDQNVDNARLFAAGHNVLAGVIAAAGMVLGNAVVSFGLSRWGYAAAQRRGARGWAMFFYWATVASVGNLWDYLPIRAWTDGTDLTQDMFVVEKGFGWSPWTLLFLFGVPAAAVIVHFLLRIEPQTLCWLSPKSFAKRATLAVLTAFFLFDFYGAAGLSDAGPVSHQLSVLSATILAPLMMLLGVWLVRNKRTA